MACFPNLETERLWLRQAIEEDAQAMFAIFCDPKMTQFNDEDTFIHLNQAIGVIERRANRFRNGRGLKG